ncbi:immunity protein Imm33 domain-containing protein [Neorhizobium huautlense]|uniref:immunity protein Imm33 domain-containing protein n=1 Tax=Neorhizobium huautlense TaxID=67774 RepID=UPI0013007460|nr:hypothetical protein [Neorhizobium huautlense]
MDQDQVEVCLRHNVEFSVAEPSSKLGISEGALQGEQPLNGLRQPPENGTCGWYIWGGRDFPPEDADFFKPMHVSHLSVSCPAVVPYLGLPPGWRFLIAPGYEDVWFDASLLDI